MTQLAPLTIMENDRRISGISAVQLRQNLFESRKSLKNAAIAVSRKQLLRKMSSTTAKRPQPLRRKLLLVLEFGIFCVVFSR